MRKEIASGTGSFVVSRDGGRISTLRPGADLPNLLWDGDAMPFPGGDRLWPAPEVDIFYDGPPEPSNWRCPPELDPGDWSMHTDGMRVRLRQVALGATFGRIVEPVEDLEAQIPWTGYRVIDEVDSDRGWMPWHLVMIPAPVRVSVLGVRAPVVYFEPAPPIVDGTFDATGEAPRWKIGFAPPRDGHVVIAGFEHRDPGGVVVIVGSAPPDGRYVDVPPDGGPATAIQVFNAGGEGFAELEHHSPTSTTASTVIGAWGSRAERRTLVDVLSRARSS